MLSSCSKPLKYTLKQTPHCHFYCLRGGGKLPFPCNFTSHHRKIWHYNPAEEEEGVGSADNPAPVRKNGFHLDSKEPDWSKFRDFIMGEVRYNSLMKTFFTGLDSIQRCSVPLTGYPQEAEELFVATERNAKLRYEGYKKLSEM